MGRELDEGVQRDWQHRRLLAGDTHHVRVEEPQNALYFSAETNRSSIHAYERI